MRSRFLIQFQLTLAHPPVTPRAGRRYAAGSDRGPRIWTFQADVALVKAQAFPVAVIELPLPSLLVLLVGGALLGSSSGRYDVSVPSEPHHLMSKRLTPAWQRTPATRCTHPKTTGWAPMSTRCAPSRRGRSRSACIANGRLGHFRPVDYERRWPGGNAVGIYRVWDLDRQNGNPGFDSSWSISEIDNSRSKASEA